MSIQLNKNLKQAFKTLKELKYRITRLNRAIERSSLKDFNKTNGR